MKFQAAASFSIIQADRAIFDVSILMDWVHQIALDHQCHAPSISHATQQGVSAEDARDVVFWKTCESAHLSLLSGC